MSLPSRRKFLQAASAFPLVTGYSAKLALASDFFPFGSLNDELSGRHVGFPSSARDRIAVASYPFREFIVDQHDDQPGRSSKMPLKDFAAHVVAKFNIRKIEPWSEHFLSTEPAYLDEIRDAAAKAGTSFADIAADGHNSLYSPDSAEREQAIEFGKTWIDVAAHLGSPSVRINIAAAKNAKPDIARVAESLKPIAAYAAAKNAVVHLENDNPVSEDPFFLVSVLDRVNSPWIHALPDFGNSLAALPPEDAYRGLDQMFAHAYAISHVKDTTTTRAKVVVQVDMNRIFALAKKHNYKGFFSMEWETAGDVYAGTAGLIATTITNLS
ncbi:MAG TPA: sugar phosphate isomerase/epimerase family protein [Candidatus Acidoferrum sp.]|jgi:sugar phosphate isomerase/epimerase